MEITDEQGIRICARIVSNEQLAGRHGDDPWTAFRYESLASMARHVLRDLGIDDEALVARYRHLFD